MGEVEVQSTGSALLALLERDGALTPIGLRLPDTISREEAEAVGYMIGSQREALHWAAGDFIAIMERLFGEEGYQLVESLNISEVSRQQYIRVATQIPIERRVRGLSWSHHRSVLALEEKDQDRYLALALKNGWTKGQLEEAIREEFKPERAARARRYVVEAVCNAAERVWEDATVSVDGNYVVPAKSMEDLMYALGVDVQA